MFHSAQFGGIHRWTPRRSAMAIVEPVPSSTAESRELAIKSPATERELGRIRVNTADDVRAVVARARRVQPSWNALGFDGREAFMRRALAILLEKQEEYIEVIRSETGRSRVETIMMEIFPACDSLSYFGKNAKRLLRDEKPPLHLLKNKKLVVTYQPLGVV